MGKVWGTIKRWFIKTELPRVREAAKVVAPIVKDTLRQRVLALLRRKIGG